MSFQRAGPAMTLSFNGALLGAWVLLLTRVDDKARIIEDPDIDMILISAIPADRAELSIAAMEAA